MWSMSVQVVSMSFSSTSRYTSRATDSADFPLCSWYATHCAYQRAQSRMCLSEAMWTNAFRINSRVHGGGASRLPGRQQQQQQTSNTNQKCWQCCYRTERSHRRAQPPPATQPVRIKSAWDNYLIVMGGFSIQPVGHICRKYPWLLILLLIFFPLKFILRLN